MMEKLPMKGLNMPGRASTSGGKLGFRASNALASI